MSEELDSPEEYTSPLRTILTEIHEIHQELVKIGFPVRIANGIVAHMILDVMMMRPGEDEDEDDEYDEYEEGLDE